MQLFDMDNYPKLKYYLPIIVTPEFVARFESKVVRDDCMPDGCHIWTAARIKSGYGRIGNNGKNVLANRASYVIYKGEISHGMQVCHKCDNPPCVNPAHLFLGTGSDNAKDSVSKGRQRNVRKTYCAQGHAFADDNLILDVNSNRRQCRICSNEKTKRYKAKKRLAS